MSLFAVLPLLAFSLTALTSSSTSVRRVETGKSLLARKGRPDTSTTSASSLVGGGFDNVVAISPNGDYAAVGGDTSGVQLTYNNASTGLGTNWYTANNGLSSSKTTALQDLHIVSLAWESNSELWAVAGNGSSLAESQILETTVSGTSPPTAANWTHVTSGFIVQGTSSGGLGSYGDWTTADWEPNPLRHFR
jgi:hypothetical protein